MSRIRRFKEFAHRAGAREAALCLGLGIANRVAAVKLLQVVAITTDRIDAGYLSLADGFDGGFSERDWLIDQATKNPELGMTPAFVQGALARGDRCYAITAGDEFASYGWYSNRPTLIDDGLELAFDPAYVYMYKGFTRPAYRGMRLHAVGMTRALDAVSAQGFKGLVSFVERSNSASLRSVHRMGYTDVVKYAVLALKRSHRIMRIGRRPTPEVVVQRACAAQAAPGQSQPNVPAVTSE